MRQAASAEDESERDVSCRPEWGGVLDCHGSRRKATGKNAFGGTVIPEEFRFSPDKSGCTPSCITGRVCRERIFTEKRCKGPNDSDVSAIEPSLEDGAWTEGMNNGVHKNFAEKGLRHGSVRR